MSSSTEERTDRLLAMGQMAASLAHEIRNPLGGMELFCSLLVKELSNEEKKKNIAEQILKGIRTVERIIQNCLQFAREIVPQKTKIQNIRDYCAEIIELVAPRAKDLNSEIRLIAPEGSAYFDPFLMQQTLVNLLTNGVDAIHERHRRELREGITSDLKNEVVLTVVTSNPLKLEVSDTGDGIDPANLSRIFDPFMTTKTSGTGLGLAICHAIVRAHGGEIRVEQNSEVKSQGVKFVITLPVEQVGCEVGGQNEVRQGL